MSDFRPKQALYVFDQLIHIGKDKSYRQSFLVKRRFLQLKVLIQMVDVLCKFDLFSNISNFVSRRHSDEF